MNPGHSPQRDHARELLQQGRYTQQQLREAVGVSQVICAKWFRKWCKANAVRIAGYGRKPRAGKTPYLWEWVK